MELNLKVKIGKLELQNPIMNASGTFDFIKENPKFFDYQSIGAFVTKTITYLPKLGNSPPRIVETSAGLLNSIGLQNPGIDNFLNYKLPELKKLKTKIIVSIGGKTIKEYIKLSSLLNEVDIDAIELNISCPNVKNQPISYSAKNTYKLTNLVRKTTSLPIIVKLSPRVTDIQKIAISAENAGADAIALINTFPSMTINIKTNTFKLGGLSGPSIKPIALRMVFEVANIVNIPVIGIGGIMNYEDVLEFIFAGATAVGIGTANFIEPMTMLKIIKDLKKYLKKNKISDINKLRKKIK